MRKVLFLSMPGSRIHYNPRFCLVFLLVIIAFILPAQELRYQFKNYTPSDGLPSSEVHKVLQDARHYMWFATDHGVCRYNGYEFKTYNLVDNSILGLYEDYKKRIWAWSFSKRLFVFEDEKWEEYKWNKKILEDNKHGIIHTLYVDSSDNVFIASNGPIAIKITSNGDVQDLIKPAGRVRIELMPTGNEELFAYVSECPLDLINGSAYSYHTYSIKYTSNSEQSLIPVPFIFFGDRMKAKKLGDEVFFLIRKELLNISSHDSYKISQNNFLIYDIEKIEGNYFFCTDDGIKIVNEKGETLKKYFQEVPIVSVKKDHEGGLWFASLTKGIYYLNSAQIEHLSEKGSVLTAKFEVLQKLNDSLLIAGTNKGEVVLVRPGVKMDILNFGHHSISSFYQRSNDSVYVAGSITFGAVKPKLQFFKHYSIVFGKMLGLSNLIKRNDSLFASSTRFLIPYSLIKERYVTPSVIEPFRASTLLNKDGEILVGNNEGLWRYINGRIERSAIQHPLLQSRITDMAKMSDSLLLLGTRGKGLVLVAGKNVMQLTEEDGIVSNYIRKIFVEKDYIWIATNRGVSIIKIRSVVPFVYFIMNSIGVKDGLLSNEVNDIINYGDKVVIASNEGMSFVDRSALINQRHLSLPFYLSSVKLRNALVNVEDLNNIGYRSRNLTVSYEALTYGNPGKVNYRYRLKGYDSTWTYTNGLEIQFTTLPYGNYSLQIEAKREFDHWENAPGLIELPVVCKPPFWATSWFWVAAFSLVMLLVVFFFRNRINLIRTRQKQQEELKQKINDTEQMALKAQMNPHFIFNSLNSIQQYVIDSDVKGANKFISEFSKLIRQTLEFSSKELITLDEKISYLCTYLDLEKTRIESGFTYQVMVQTERPSSHIELPPLLLQPYVENALRHGIRYLKDTEGVILLSFIENAGWLECIIEDNGVGRKQAMELKVVNPIEYQSRGMLLTAERIALLNEGKERKIEVIIEDLKDNEGNAAGTRIRALFPV